MSVYYQYGYKCIFRTREEAVQLATDRGSGRWCGNGPEPENRLQKQLDRITPIEIDAEPIYNKTGTCGDEWSLWSDGKFRELTLSEVCRPVINGKVCSFLSERAVEISPSPVSDRAASFISAAYGSDNACPAWIGEIRDVVSERHVQTGESRGVYARKKITEYVLQLISGQRKVWVFSVGYFEGYAFEICESWKEAKKTFEVPSCPHLECFECGAVYDKPGHVEWGQMGCDRCNS